MVGTRLSICLSLFSGTIKEYLRLGGFMKEKGLFGFIVLEARKVPASAELPVRALYSFNSWQIAKERA